jgi:hypothetical protein
MAKKKPENKPAQPKKPARKPPDAGPAGDKAPGARGKPARKKRGPTEPSRPTVKRLFAVSGNWCAFSRCISPMVDPASGSIIGQVCHIKGENPGPPPSARYDPGQSDEERHGFDNLILLCGPHHKVIDDDERTYTVERLLELKKEHEGGQVPTAGLTDDQADRLIANISGNTITGGSILLTHNQSGGHVAHTINVYNQTPPEDDEVVVTGALSVSGDLEVLQAFGCPGVRLTVTCRSKRPAKIRGATLCAEGRGFLAAFGAGFAAPFHHDPPEGMESETLYVKLVRLSPPHSPEGYTLQRDDVCRFFLPVAIGGLGVFATAPPEVVTLRVTFFDGSERVLLRGEEVQHALRGLMEMSWGRAYQPKVIISGGVRVSSTTLPDDEEAVGTVNKKPILFAPPGPTPAEAPSAPVRVSLGVADVQPGGLTLGVEVANLSPQPLEEVTVTFRSEREGVPALTFAGVEQGPIPTGQRRHFLLPVECVTALKTQTATSPPTRYWLAIASGGKELLRLPGVNVWAAVMHLKGLARAKKQRG